ncbi:MAG TPA: GNAT family N-acetyltransferase [Longimicrobiales bacterium]|nr:GNAT family N-acetyltransferase [Longimicrobiales bacterium]
MRLIQPATARSVVLREALPNDVEEMHSLLDGFAREGLLLPRAVEEVYRNFREFVVAEHDGRIVGCAGLRLYSSELGEIVGLAVSEESHGMGVGRLMVETLLAQAKSLGLNKVVALTLQPNFFYKLGFEPTLVAEYPQKIAADCSRCAKRSTCIEIAVAYELEN